MNRYLQEGAVLKNPTDKGGVYKIKDIIGTGTTCVVYRADFLSNDGPETQHLLKEYNPRTIALDRADDYSLYVRNEKDSQTFNEGLDRFKEGINKQAEVRRCSVLTNSTSNIQHTFTANNTFYVDMTLMAGETYDKVKEKSLHDLLRRIKAITKVVNNYHQQGLLHLDIKPENIFTLLDTVELVQMFDFDSVIEKDKVISAPTMSYTQNWAAQEQILPYGRKRICEATDLFAIGEILFYKLMDRHSTSSERYSYVSYQFDTASELFKGINPKLFPVLAEILGHTICNVVSKRYQSADILLKKLDEAIDLANPTKPFLQHSLPCKAAFFVGRDFELSEIDNRLKQADKLFITGMGGMGKSELCKQYAHLHKDEYDAVVFAVCNTDLESMILDDSALPIANMQMASGEKASEYFKRKYPVLKSLCTKRVLLVVDNLNDMQDGRLNDILQLNCKMLITTRCDVTDYNYEQFYLGAIEGATHIRSLFDHWYPEELLSAADNAAVEQILTMYARHTLAIELIAKQMRASNIKPQKMLEKLTVGGLNCSGKERVVHDGAAKTNTYGHIRHLFDVSGLSDNQIYILANLSLIPISGINKEQFYDWCKSEDYDDINILVESGWVQQDTEKDLLSLHPVIADIILGNSTKTIAQCEQLLEAIDDYLSDDNFDILLADTRNTFIFLGKGICDRLCKFGSFPDFAVNFVNTIAIHCHSFGNIDTYVSHLCRALEISKASSGEQNETVARIFNTLGSVHLAANHYDQAESSYLTSLDYKLSIYGEFHESTATTYDHLGTLYHELGRFRDSKEYYTKAFNIRMQLKGEHSKEVANSFSNLATIYFDLAELEKAKKYGHKALKLYGKFFGYQHINTAIVYDNLGVIYDELGLLNDSFEFHKRALEIRLAIYGKNHSDVAISYDNIGGICAEMDKFQEAEDYYKKALSIRQHIFGEVNSETAVTYNNLGSLYQRLCQYDRAEQSWIKAANIVKGLFGESHPLVATIYSNLGTLYDDLEKFDEAKVYHEKALEVCAKLFGPNHPDIAISNNNLGTLHLALGHYSAAKKHFLQAAQIWSTAYGETHPRLGVCYNNLGIACYKIGQYKEAEAFYKKSISVKKHLYGDNHTTVATTYGTLGELCLHLEQFNKAKQLFSKALQILLKEYGKYHISTAVAYNNLGSLMYNLDCSEKAKEYFHIALDIRLKILGKKHTDIPSTYYNLAIVYDDLEQYDKAEVYFKKALKSRIDICGLYHVDVAESYHDLGEFYYKQKRHALSLKYFDMAQKTFEKVLGKEHKRTISSYSTLGKAYMLCGQYGLAKKVFLCALEIGQKELGENHSTVLLTKRRLEKLRVLERKQSDK